MNLMRFIVLGFIYLFSLSSFAMDTPLSVMSLWDGELQTINPTPGDFFYRIISAKTDNPSYIDINYGKDVDLTGRFIQFQIRVNSYENWGGIELRLSSDDQFNNYYSIPVPYFSDADFNIIQPNHWSDYTLSLGEAKVTGQPDKTKIKKIGFYIQGRSVSNTRFEVDLKNFQIKTSLSRAIISMTFDDGYAEQFKAAEIMNRYGLRGTAYIMSNEIDQSAYMTSAQLLSLKKDFGWGLSSHHKIPITDMTTDEYIQEMLKTQEFLFNLGVSAESLHFAYPLGKQSRQTTISTTQELFLTARTAGGGSETLPPADWLMLKTFNVTPDLSAKELSERINKAIENREWLILMFHMFTEDETATDPLVFTFSEFEKLCDVIQKSNISVHPVHEVYEAFQ